MAAIVGLRRAGVQRTPQEILGTLPYVQDVSLLDPGPRLLPP